MVKITTIPSQKEELKVNEKIEAVLLDRNKVIAKRFGVEPEVVDVELYYNTSQLVSKVGSHDQRLGVFSGYIDYQNYICLAHPTAVGPIFGENIDKQISIMTDYCLIKLYLCKNYYPNPVDYNLFYKHFSNALSKITSGNFQKAGINFMIKNYSEHKMYKKDEEILLSLYVMLEKSGVDFIYENLKVFMEDCNIKKSLMKVYKKEFKELVGLYKKELDDVEKKMKKV
ncbi:MAG: hypothetical protein PF569_06140 [Candidatus Woesearchaeota archaeon]|jgi:hypothetical protein|nr:hypothetical protein [Candidatus Woesearchaeota archaeon]